MFVTEEAITGGGGFGKGWSEIKIKPGAFAKAAMRFDYGRFNESVSGLEIGMSAEFYASEIPYTSLPEKEAIIHAGLCSHPVWKAKITTLTSPLIHS
ncbi:MAG: hypothetical protein WDO16_07545 [Bacteroidota bacterium]